MIASPFRRRYGSPAEVEAARRRSFERLASLRPTVSVMSVPAPDALGPAESPASVAGPNEEASAAPELVRVPSPAPSGRLVAVGPGLPVVASRRMSSCYW